MVWIVVLIVLPFVLIIAGILFFNVYLQKQITKDTACKPVIDQAYIEAEQTRGDDEDLLGGAFKKTE